MSKYITYDVIHIITNECKISEYGIRVDEDAIFGGMEKGKGLVFIGDTIINARDIKLVRRYDYGFKGLEIIL